MIDELIEAPPAVTDQVTTALAEVSRTNATITRHLERARALAAQSKDVAYDVETPKGLEEAKRARAALRDEGRYPIQKLQATGSKMLGTMQRQFNARCAEVVAEIEGYEKPIDDQITAVERRKEAEKAAREQAEREAAAVVQGRIDAIRAYAVIPAGVKAAGIRVAIDNLTAVEVSIEAYGDRAGEAAQAKAQTLARMEELHAAAIAHEAEQERIAAEREELARMRAEQEARDKAERERIAAEQAAEAKRLAEARAALAKEEAAAKAARDKADAEARAKRDEEDRIARAARAAEDQRIARERAELEAQQRAARLAEEEKAAAARREAEAKAAAERKAEQDRLDAIAAQAREAAAAEQRRLDEEAAARRAAEEAAHKAAQRVRDAAPALLAALVIVRDAYDDCQRDGIATIPATARKVIGDAIELATGEPE